MESSSRASMADIRSLTFKTPQDTKKTKVGDILKEIGYGNSEDDFVNISEKIPFIEHKNAVLLAFGFVYYRLWKDLESLKLQREKLLKEKESGTVSKKFSTELKNINDRIRNQEIRIKTIPSSIVIEMQKETQIKQNIVDVEKDLVTYFLIFDRIKK